jgi:hypothetical protein
MAENTLTWTAGRGKEERTGRREKERGRGKEERKGEERRGEERRGMRREA